MLDRERKVDVENLGVERADELANQLGEHVRNICDEAVNKANQVLKIYGLEVKMQFSVGALGSFDKKEEIKPTPKKRGRKSKKLIK